MTVPTGPARSRWKRAAVAVGLTFLTIIGLLGASGYLLYRHLDHNITVDSSADNLLGRPSASAATQQDTGPMNILVMGSDTRIGQGSAYGSAAVYNTSHSDVVMLVHLYAGRKRALVMSIPRDTWVHLPVCKSGGATNGGFDGKFNEAFTIGGPACTIKLVEQVLHVPVDHFVVLDFTGVRDIINAMGGVQFCLKTPMNDPIVNGHGSGLNLPAGQQTIMGDQGLAFLRARYAFGDGSDIGRLKRQHAFLGAMVKQLQEQAVLTNLPRLIGMLDTITRSIVTDTGLGSLLRLKDLATTLTGLKPADVTFVTIPWKDRGDGANVLIDWPAAQPIVDAMAADTPYPPPPTRPSNSPLVTPPASVYVRVVNASGTSGQGTKAADELAALGFQISSVAVAPTTSATTVVHYAPSRNESGRTLTAAVKGATSVVDPSLSSTLVLYVGKDFTGVQAVTIPGPTSPPATAAVQTASAVGCV